MGLFRFLKKQYDEAYNLEKLDSPDNSESLEDLIYDSQQVDSDEDTQKRQGIDWQSNQDQEPKQGSQKLKHVTEEADEKTKKRQNQIKLEEERYDYLLNSVQAQGLIDTVDAFQNKKEQDKSLPQKDTTGEPDNAAVSGENKQINIVLPDIRRKPKELDMVNTDKFKSHDIELYVKSQCDIMEEASIHIESAKAEYESVTEHFNDIQLIEEAPQDMKLNVFRAAERVENLSRDRRTNRPSESKLSNHTYRKMEMYEDEIPRGIKFLKKQEEYFDAVSHDIRILEGERMSYKLEAKGLVKRQLKIRQYSMFAIFMLALVFAVFIVALSLSQDNSIISMFIWVVVLSGVLALGLLALLKSAERQVYVTEIRLNKATAMLNKVKIKYINAANTLDYEYNKYNIASSYELEQKYKMYLEMRDEQKQIARRTSSLNAAEQELQDCLRKIGVHVPGIWLSQVRALLDPKEMVEVRHHLAVKRQKLRSQMEYNEGRLVEAKENIKEIAAGNPQYESDALRVVSMYEKKHISQ